MTPEIIVTLIVGLTLAFFFIFWLWLRVSMLQRELLDLAENTASFAGTVNNALKGIK